MKINLFLFIRKNKINIVHHRFGPHHYFQQLISIFTFAVALIDAINLINS